MFTLKELKNMVKQAGNAKRVPSRKGILQSDSKIVVSKSIGYQAKIEIYDNGYVMYTVGRYCTVFPLHFSSAYRYGTVSDTLYLSEEDMENEVWYVRLVLEGEDRIAHNQNNRQDARIVSYSGIGEDWKVLGTRMSLLEEMLEHEKEECTEEKVLSLLTEKQRYVVKRQYMDHARQEEISEELGVSQQAVSDMSKKAKRRLERHYKCEKISLL